MRYVSRVWLVGTSRRLVSPATAAWRVVQADGLRRSPHLMLRNALVVRKADFPRIPRKQFPTVPCAYQAGGARWLVKSTLLIVFPVCQGSIPRFQDKLLGLAGVATWGCISKCGNLSRA